MYLLHKNFTTIKTILVGFVLIIIIAFFQCLSRTVPIFTIINVGCFLYWFLT